MYRGRKVHFGRNYFSKNIIFSLKKQHKKDGMICEHITPPMVILYIFPLHIYPQIVLKSFSLLIWDCSLFIPKVAQIGVCFKKRATHL